MKTLVSHRRRAFSVLWTLSLGLIVLAALGAPVSAQIVQQEEPVAANVWKAEPILIFDATGQTLSGVSHLSLKVYNNGLATIAKKFPLFPFDPSYVEANAHTLGVTEAEADQLRLDLIAAGAATLGDNPDLVLDIPLKTVTFFQSPGPRACSNTFSYWLATGAWAPVQQVIDDFIDFHFPNFV